MVGTEVLGFSVRVCVCGGSVGGWWEVIAFINALFVWICQNGSQVAMNTDANPAWAPNPAFLLTDEF